MSETPMSTIPFIVGRERVFGSAGTITSVNPATGQTNYEVSAAGAADVDSCVEAATAAVRDRRWRGMLQHERARILSAIADGMTARAEILAEIQMRENGKVIGECRAQVKS